MGEAGGGWAAEVVEVALDQGQVAVGEVVEALGDAGAGGDAGHGRGRVEAGAAPALVGGGSGHHLGHRGDDHRVAEVQHAGRVGAGGVGPDHVDVVVVGPGAVGQLPDVGRAQQGRGAAEDLGSEHGLGPGQLREVAVVADQQADPGQLGVDHHRPVAAGDPAALVAVLEVEDVGLAVAAEDVAGGPDEGGGVVDRAPGLAALVAAGDDVGAQAGGGLLEGLGDRAGDLADQVPEGGGVDGGGVAGGGRLGKDDEVGAGGGHAALDVVDAGGQVGLDGGGGEGAGGGGDLDGGGGEGAHVSGEVGVGRPGGRGSRRPGRRGGRRRRRGPRRRRSPRRGGGWSPGGRGR